MAWLIAVASTKGFTEEGLTFPPTITPPASAKCLTLIGNGVTDMTIETILVKFSAIAVYVEPEIGKHLQAWKGKPASELVAEGSSYFSDFVNAPVQKLVIVGIIKGIRGSAYAGGLESSIRDRLANDDKYEEEEEAKLEELVKYLSTHNLPVGSSIFFHWPSPSAVQVTVSPDGSVPKQPGNSTENENIAKFLLHWLIGENSVSESTALSTAEGVAAL
ncbi:unnamed protein product [Calypogeia fissa]